MSKSAIFIDHVKTPLGTFQIVATRYGLREVHFPHSRTGCRPIANKPPASVESVLKNGKVCLRSYLAGKAYRGKSISIDWAGFKSFDQRVLKTLLKRTKAGQTVSYSELAERCGKPRAQRAVGNALNRNPIPILIPCHRVVRKDQSLGGYGGGLQWKRILLNLEKSFES